jgi:hypothetical protein
MNFNFPIDAEKENTTLAGREEGWEVQMKENQISFFINYKQK